MRIRSILSIGLLFFAIFVSIGIVLCTQRPVVAQSGYATSDNYTMVTTPFSVDPMTPGHSVPQGSIIRHLKGGITEIEGPDHIIIARAKDSDAQFVPIPERAFRATHVYLIPDKSMIMSKNNVTRVYSGGNLILTVINEEQELPAATDDTWLEWVATKTSTNSVDYYSADWTVPQTPENYNGPDMPNVYIFNGIIPQNQPTWIIQPVLRWNVNEDHHKWSCAAYYVKGETEGYIGTSCQADEGDSIRGVMRYWDGAWIVNIYNTTKGVSSSVGTSDFGTANHRLTATLEARGKLPPNIDNADIPGTIQFTNMQATYNSNPISTTWEPVEDKIPNYPLISYLHPTLDSDTNPTTCTLYTSGGHMEVDTGNATNIGSTSATLHGDLTHFGLDTGSSAQVSLDYGTDPNLGTYDSTPPQTKTETGSFQETITNLNPGTAYYYRAKAQGTKSSAEGDIRSFPTLPSPPPPPPPDTTPPTVSITSPTNGQTFTTPSITVSGTAQDDVAVSKVEVQVGSGGWQQASGTTSWSLQVALSSGSNTIYARATDTSNNVTPTPASVTVTYNPLLDITTTSLPDGTVDVPYSQTLQASGGTGTYTWSITTGSLPTGLSLDSSTGVISGTPTATGTSDFTVQVDDGSTTDDQPLSIEVTVTVTLQKLLGADDSTATGDTVSNYFILDRFAASNTGTVDEIRIKCGESASGSVKVAIYADSSGSPGALLSAANTGTEVSPGWNTISITSTPVTAGEYYWLAFNAESPCVSYKQGGTNTRCYRQEAYSDFSFPDPAGSGFTTRTAVFYDYIAGWGTAAP